MDFKKIMFELCEISSISGMEGKVSERIAELFKPYCDTVEIDGLYNVIATKKASVETEETLLIDAHLDEIGLVVTHVTDNGFLKFDNNAGVDRRTILATEVTVHARSGDYFGIVTAMPPHLTAESEMEKTPTFDSLYIDVGFDGEKAKEIFAPGNFITLRQSPCELLGSVMTGKTFDDRSAVIAILEAFYALRDINLPYNVVALLSSQEETGLRSARVAAFTTKPTEAIVIDVTHAYIPDCPRDQTVTMGKGTVLSHGQVLDRGLTDTLKAVADTNGIPVQMRVAMGRTGTNAYTIFNANNGVKTALISIPLKYMHSVVETLDYKDVKATSRLLKEYMLHKKEVQDA